MDQNGSYYTADSLNGEDGGYIDDFENSSLKKQHLHNGHHKRLKSPQNSMQEFERLERFFNSQNSSIADDHFEADQDYRWENDRSIPRDSFAESDSSYDGFVENKRRYGRKGMNNGSVLSQTDSVSSFGDGMVERRGIPNGVDHHDRLTNGVNDIKSLSDGGSARNRRHSGRNRMGNGSVLSQPNSLASTRDVEELRHRLSNGVGHHNGWVSEKGNIEVLSGGVHSNRGSEMNNGSMLSSADSLSGSRGGVVRGHRLPNGVGHRDEDNIEPFSDHVGLKERVDSPSGVNMMKYMERTPRRTLPQPQQPSSLEDVYDSPGDRSLGSNTNYNNNKNALQNGAGNHSIKSENLISLSKEEPPSHLQHAYDSGDATDDDQSDLLGETVIPAGLEEAIQAAALNVEDFKTKEGSSCDIKENERSDVNKHFQQVTAPNDTSRKSSSRHSSRRSSVDSHCGSKHSSVEDVDHSRSSGGRQSASKHHSLTASDDKSAQPTTRKASRDSLPRSIHSSAADDVDDSRNSESKHGSRWHHSDAASDDKTKRSSSRRSSRNSLSRSKHSSASEDFEEPSHLPYKTSYKGSVGDPLKNYRSEATSFQERRFTKIPGLNLGGLTDTEVESDTPRSKEELSSRLSEERQTRRQATKVNHELQREYDELLAKYAQAENTIDQLRLGAKVNLFSDGPQKGRSSLGQVSPGKQPLKLEIGRPKRASTEGGLRNGSQSPGDTDQTKSGDMRNAVANLSQQASLLERAIDTHQVPPGDQQALFDRLKQNHTRLEDDYMQRREEAQERHRWDSVLLDSGEDPFDPDKSLEGQIFQVGMQLEELQEKVEENLRNNPPFTPNRRHSISRQQSATEDIPKEGDSPHNTPEYNRLLQKYEALKQLPGTPKRDKEIQKLVKDLDDLHMTPEEQHEQEYLSERSDGPSPQRQSSRRGSPTPSSGRGSHSPTPSIGGRGDHSNDESSGRGTPSSAKSLEGRRSISKERKSRIPKKAATRSLPRLDTKTPVDSGSSHPRTPEYEDSGFVGSEGSRQSQQSKQNLIPRTIPLHNRTDGSRQKSRPYHTPIQELSERGQSSTSETRRQSRTPRKAEVSTTSEEENHQASLERPLRLSRKLVTPSKDSRHQHPIISPLPSKPKLQDFQRRSPPETASQRTRSRSSSRVSPKDAERESLQSELLAPGRIAESSKDERPRLTKTREAQRVHRLNARRDSDLPSSASKRSSAKSEQMSALRKEIDELKQQLQTPQRGRTDLKEKLQAPKRGRRTRSMSVGTEREERSSVSDREKVHKDRQYSDDDYESEGSYEKSSTRSLPSARSERSGELRDELDRLRERVRAATDDRGRERHRGPMRVAPSATSTPNSRTHQREGDRRAKYGRPERTRSLDRLLPREKHEAETSSPRGKYKESYEDGKYRRRAPSLEQTAHKGEREALRETLRKSYVPTAVGQPRHVHLPDEQRDERNGYPSREFGYPGKGGVSPLRGDTSQPVGADYDQTKSYQKYQPLSSLEATPPQAYHEVNKSPQQGATPCQHCNGSGVHHSHTGVAHSHHSPPMQQYPSYGQTSPNGTIFVPQGSPVYHSTPATVRTHGTPVNIIQGVPHSQGQPLSQAPVLPQGQPVIHVKSSPPQQQVTPGAVIGNATVLTSPQGSLVYTNQQPVTVLGPGTHQVHVPSPQTVPVQTVPVQVQTVPAQTSTVPGQIVTVPAERVAVPGQVLTVPAQAVMVSPPKDQSPTHSSTVDGARPVYLVPSTKGRYYVRDKPIMEDPEDVEEIVYRRTPVKRSPNRKSHKVELHSRMEVEDLELDDSLRAACQMAQRLKRSSERVLESVEGNLRRSGRKMEYH